MQQIKYIHIIYRKPKNLHMYANLHQTGTALQIANVNSNRDYWKTSAYKISQIFSPKKIPNFSQFHSFSNLQNSDSFHYHSNFTTNFLSNPRVSLADSATLFKKDEHLQHRTQINKPRINKKIKEKILQIKNWK